MVEDNKLPLICLMKYDVRTAIKASPYLKGIANVPCKHFAHGRDASVAEERNPAVEETFRVLGDVDVASTAQNVSVLRNRNAKGMPAIERR